MKLTIFLILNKQSVTILLMMSGIIVLVNVIVSFFNF